MREAWHRSRASIYYKLMSKALLPQRETEVKLIPIVIELLYLLSMVWIAMELEGGIYTPSVVFIEYILRLGYIIHCVHMMSCDLVRGAMKPKPLFNPMKARMQYLRRSHG